MLGRARLRRAEVRAGWWRAGGRSGTGCGRGEKDWADLGYGDRRGGGESWARWWRTGDGRSYGPAMANIQSRAAARKRVRESQARAQEERARRERENLEDMATFLVSRNRIATVDDWQAERVAQAAAEAARRRDEHRRAAAAALARIRARGETISAIAQVAETTEGEVRSYLKLASANGGEASAAVTEGSGAAGTGSEPLGAAAGASADTVTYTGDVGGGQ